MLISVFEYPWSERLKSGTKVRAVFQREIPDTVEVNWAGWLTGAAIVASIWLTAIFILA